MLRSISTPDMVESRLVTRIAEVYNTGGGPHFGSGLTINTAAGLYETRT
jgi:hypothetical protein